MDTGTTTHSGPLISKFNGQHPWPSNNSYTGMVWKSIVQPKDLESDKQISTIVATVRLQLVNSCPATVMVENTSAIVS